MRPRRQIAQLAAASCAAAAVAACTGGHSDSDDVVPTSQAHAGARPGTDPSRHGPAPEIEGAATGGTLTVRVSFGLRPTCLHAKCVGISSVLDPSANYYTDSAAISSGLITRSLTQYVWDPESDGPLLVPDLATDLGRPNSDYTEWAFTIRDGVRFEDGTPVTAADVAYGIKRSMDLKEFPSGPTYGNDYFLHGDAYKGLYHGGSDYDGVVVDGQNLTIKMSRPFPDMPYYGAFPQMGPIPASGSDPATYGRHPLATGPYKVKEFTPDKSLTLVRNDEWDPDTDPGRHQYVDEFDFLLGQHMGAVWPDLLADRPQTQTTLSYDDVPPDLIQDAKQTAGERLLVTPTQCLFDAWPDYRTVDDIRIRQALGYAWPYRQVIERVLRVPGATGFFASSILPPGTPGRVDYAPLATPAGETDPAKSRALLAEAGYGPGDYRIDFAYDKTGFPVSEIIIAALEGGGFHVIAQGYGPARYQQVRSDPDAPVDLRLAGWCADWPSGGSWLPPLFTGPVGDADPNFGFFHEDAVDAEADRILRLPLDEQDAAWGRLDQMIEEKFYPIIPTLYLGTAQLHGSRVGGLHLDTLAGMPTYRDLYVLPAQG